MVLLFRRSNYLNPPITYVDMVENFLEGTKPVASVFLIQNHPSIPRPDPLRFSPTPWTLHWLTDHISGQASANSPFFWWCHIAFALRLKLWPNSHFLPGNYLTVAKQHYSDRRRQLHLERLPKEAWHTLSPLQSESNLCRNELWRGKK